MRAYTLATASAKLNHAMTAIAGLHLKLSGLRSDCALSVNGGTLPIFIITAEIRAAVRVLPA